MNWFSAVVVVLLSALLGARTSLSEGFSEFDDCSFRRNCTVTADTKNAFGGFSSLEQAVQRAQTRRKPFPGDPDAPRHKIGLSCPNEDALVAVAKHLVQDGGSSFFLNKKRGYALLATFNWKTGQNRRQPVSVPLLTFLYEPGKETEETKCSDPSIFPYIHPRADVTITFEIRRTKETDLSPTLSAGAKLFVALIGLFTGGTNAVLTAATSVSKALGDNEKEYDKFLDRFDLQRIVRQDILLSPSHGEARIDLGQGAVILITREAQESPLIDKRAKDGKRVRNSLGVASTLSDFYSIDSAAIFKGLQTNILDQLRDPKYVANACQTIQGLVRDTPGLLEEEKLIVLVDFLSRFDGPNPPIASCLSSTQTPMLAKYEIEPPYKPQGEKPAGPSEARISLREINAFLSDFFGKWRSAHTATTEEPTENTMAPLVQILADRVRLGREDDLTSFSANQQASEDAAARALLKGPKLLLFGCYRLATGELERIGYTAEVLASFGDPAKPLVTNIAVGVRPSEEQLTINALYVERPTRATREEVQKRFSTGCAGWKPFG